MTPSVPAKACEVTGAELLPPASGGETALCAAIQEAASAAGLEPGYRVEVRVGKRRSLDGVLVLAGGRRLPELSLEVSDAPLSGAIYRQFAAELVGQAKRKS